MSARSLRIAGPVELVAAVDTLLYTVPADRTLLVKSVRVVHVGAELRALDVCIGATVPGNAAFLWQAPIEPGRVVVDAGWTVLEPGEELRARADAAGLVLTVSGALLVGVA